MDEVQDFCLLECYSEYADAYADVYIAEFMACAQNKCGVSTPEDKGCGKKCYVDKMTALDPKGLVDCFQSCEDEPTPSDCNLFFFLNGIM